MNWFEDQIKNRLQNDEDDFSGAFTELSSVVMGESAAKAGLVTPRQRTHNAVQEILKFFGQEVVPVPDSVTDTEEYINYCLKPTGIMKRRVQLTGKWWKDASGPMMGMVKRGGQTEGEDGGETVALLPSKNGYSYFDYECGKRVALTSETAKNLETTAYCFYKPLPNRALSVMDLVKYMFKTITKGDIFFYLAVLAVTTLIGLIQPRISLILFSDVVPNGTAWMLPALGVMMVSIVISTQVLSMSQNLIMQRLTMRLSNTIEPAAMMRVLNLPAGFFKQYAAGELSQKLSLIPSICNSIFSIVTGTLLNALFSLAYFSQIASITPALLVPALCIIGVTLAVNIITTIASMKIQRKSLEASASLSGLTYSMLSGIQKVKLTGSEKRIFARWAGSYKTAANYTYNPPFLLKYTETISTAITAIGTVVIYFTSIMSGVDAGEYMAYSTAYGMVAASILSLGSLTTFFSGLKPQLDVVSPIMKAIPEISAGKTVVTSLSGGIEVQNLTFRYDEGGRNVLDGINIKIRPGKYVAIVGKTGCGKSTLIRLLLGFEQPNKGAVYFDGKDITRLDLPSLRRKIGAVMQSGKLFTGDIFSNITISAPSLTQDEAWEAAKIADIADDIEAMPMGMHTVITEGSGGVSGGQKQRLMIARAVAPKPKILIFDESTSALDNITQKHVADALSGLKCTRIVIAHRLSTIKDCDRIYVLDGGKITEEGTFDELYAKKGYFHELVSRQMVGEETTS
ncbi:MAG TPA: NHLP family bacteriocin export ABC transporter permease/ATPase subunit [Clostridiales bacterium]|nr:NHLP family bacteriocin export ABC transporter permease/ATPase subunit [Clostridiales bacterium]